MGLVDESRLRTNQPYPMTKNGALIGHSQRKVYKEKIHLKKQRYDDTNERAFTL